MLTPRITSLRPGLSLLEVLVALAIFLMSFVVLAALVSLGTDHATEVREKSLAVTMAQTKLAEVSSGIVSLEEVTLQPMEEDETFAWSLELGDPSFPNVSALPQGLTSDFKHVTVRIHHKDVRGEWQERCAISQFVLSPLRRGSTLDNNPNTTTEDTEGSGSGSTTP